MNFIRQFSIILSVSLFGELAHKIIPLPVPASIYGLILMLLLLFSGAVRICHVEKASSFLLEIMPVIFVPAAAGIIDAWQVLKPVLGASVIIITLATLTVMIISGVTAQNIIRLTEKRENKDGDNK